MDASLASKLENMGAIESTELLSPPRELTMAATLQNGEKSVINRMKVATIHTELHIRHGTALVLRNLRWYVTAQNVGEPLLSRPVLEALGLSTRNVLASAAERYAGVTDVSELLMDKDCLLYTSDAADD